MSHLQFSEILIKDNVIAFQAFMLQEWNRPINDLRYITNCLQFDAFECLKAIWHSKFAHPKYCLFESCFSGRAVHELVRLGASPATSYEGEWPITQMSNLECVDALMTYPNVDINSVDHLGKTILDYSIAWDWIFNDVCELVEHWMPKLKPGFYFPRHAMPETLWEQYFWLILPQRHARCTQSVLFVIHCRLLPVKDVCLLVACHVWNSRRDPIWDSSS